MEARSRRASDVSQLFCAGCGAPSKGGAPLPACKLDVDVSFLTGGFVGLFCARSEVFNRSQDPTRFEGAPFASYLDLLIFARKPQIEPRLSDRAPLPRFPSSTCRRSKTGFAFIGSSKETFGEATPPQGPMDELPGQI